MTSNLLQQPTFILDCAALSQREIESKYGGNGLTREALRELYKTGRESALKTLSESVHEQRADYQVKTFFGDDAPKQVDEHVDELGHLSQLVYINGAKQVDTGSLIVMNATFGESQKLHKQAIFQIGNLFETLREIHDRKAYLHLNCISFDAYMEKLKKEAGYLNIEKRTFYRKLAQKEVATILSEAGVDTRNLTQSEAAELHKLPEAIIPDVYKRAQELSANEPPEGKAAEFHHPGKVYLPKLQQAIYEVADQVSGTEDADPFEPEPEPARPTRQDFFDEQNRAKPLPPQEATETAQETRSEEKEPSRLGYVRMTRHTGKEGDFLSIVGDDGYEEYEILARVEDVRRMIR